MVLLALPMGILAIRLFFSTNEKKDKSKLFMLLCFLLIVFFVGLRSRYVGSADTRIYSFMFEQAQGQNLLDFLSSKDIIPRSFIYSEGSFYFLTWILAQVFDDAQAFILITTAIINYGVAAFIWKNAKSDTLSWVLYVCLGSLTFSMNGMRQAIAMSICLFAFEFAKQKKLLKFLLVILLAFTFHRTSVVFLLVYPICNYKPSVFTNTIVGIGSIAFLLNTRRIVALYDYFVGEDYALASEMESGGLVTVLIYAIVILSALVYLSLSNKDSRKSVMNLTLLSFVGLLFYISRYFSTQIYERISYYFFFFIILLLPEVESLFNKNSRFFFKCIVVLMAILLFAYRLSIGSFADFEFYV